MDDDSDSPMRKLGRWAGRIRAGFMSGLHGEQDNLTGGASPPRQPHPEGGTTKKRVIARRTTIEEIEIRGPECR